MDRRLGELLPHQLANPTRATPRADCSFPSQGVPGISGSFPPLSPAPGHIPTRYSPVRRSPCGALDLHVLGLPPAFVLSQDQTLRLIAGPRHHPKTVAQSLIRALQRTARLLSKLQSQVPLPPAVSRQQKRTRPKHMSSSAVPRITRHRSLFQSSGTQPSRRRPPRRPRIPSSHDHLSKNSSARSTVAAEAVLRARLISGALRAVKPKNARAGSKISAPLAGLPGLFPLTGEALDPHGK
jgi:hypothetical protein